MPSAGLLGRHDRIVSQLNESDIYDLFSLAPLRPASISVDFLPETIVCK